MKIRTSPVGPRMAWVGSELGQSDDWIDRIQPEEMKELIEAGRRLPADPSEWWQYNRASLPLPTLAPRLDGMARELELGRGFVLLRGLATDLAESEVKRWYWVLGVHLGRMVAQNRNGDLIGQVADRGGQYGKDPHARGYTSSAEMRFHNDGSDVVSLLCVRPAKSGGQNEIVSSMTIYNRILEESPETIETLYRGFPYYIRLSETSKEGNERGQIGSVRDAAYIYHDGRLSGGINMQSIRSWSEVTGKQFAPEEARALEVFEEIANRPALGLTVSLEAGDLLLVNNYMVMHKRRSFIDYDDPSRKRLLLRFWLNLHIGRTLPQDTAKAVHRNGFGTPEEFHAETAT